MKYYLTIKNELLPFMTTWMDLEGIMLCEMSDRERQILHDLAYMWNLKEKQTNKKQKQTHGYKEQTSGCQRRGMWGNQ